MLFAEVKMKDYNVMSHQGITDKEMLLANGGPEKFAGTSKVNTFMVNKVYHENIESGMPKKEANIRRVEAQKLVKATKEWRGY
jgi:hypothetical protein|tara:strand:+ start:53 stop:301 length:249 start_codon:yes stop_codon:yes gene_type:complete